MVRDWSTFFEKVEVVSSRIEFVVVISALAVVLLGWWFYLFGNCRVTSFYKFSRILIFPIACYWMAFFPLYYSQVFFVLEASFAFIFRRYPDAKRDLENGVVSFNRKQRLKEADTFKYIMTDEDQEQFMLDNAERQLKKTPIYICVLETVVPYVLGLFVCYTLL